MVVSAPTVHIDSSLILRVSPTASGLARVPRTASAAADGVALGEDAGVAAAAGAFVVTSRAGVPVHDVSARTESSRDADIGGPLHTRCMTKIGATELLDSKERWPRWSCRKIKRSSGRTRRVCVYIRECCSVFKTCHPDREDCWRNSPAMSENTKGPCGFAGALRVVVAVMQNSRWRSRSPLIGGSPVRGLRDQPASPERWNRMRPARAATASMRVPSAPAASSTSLRAVACSSRMCEVIRAN